MNSPPDRKLAVSISIAGSLLNHLDDHAHRLRRSRSELVTDCIEAHLLDLEAEAES